MRAPSSRRAVGFLAVGCGLVLLSTGCLHPRKATWQRLAAKAKGKAAGNIGGELFFGGGGPPLVINDTNVDDYIAGTVTNGDVQVSYSPSLQAHAALLAQLTEHSLKGVRALAGMPLPTRLHPYLIHLPGGGRDIHFSLSLSNFQQSIPWVIPLTNVALAVGSSANRPDAAILHDLDSVPGILFVITHEISEMTLVNPGNPLALGDYKASWGGARRAILHWTFKYHTRWFREGYSSYLGFHAQEACRQQLARLSPVCSPGEPPFKPPRRQQQPFSKLAKVKANLFRWNQNSRHALDEDYYAATLGLFLVLERRFGPDAIQRVVRELPHLAQPDGKGILKLFHTRLGLDLRQVAEQFVFPDLGLTFAESVNHTLKVKAIRPGSPAAAAGLPTGATILEINGQPVSDLFDYEWRLFEATDAHQPLSATWSYHGKRETRRVVLGHPPAGQEVDSQNTLL